MNQHKWTINCMFLHNGEEVETAVFEVKASQREIVEKLKDLQVRIVVCCTITDEFWLHPDDVFFKGFSPIKKAFQDQFPAT